jgi:hypothetical protein
MWIFLTDLHKSVQEKISRKIRPVEAELIHANRRVDRKDELRIQPTK